MRATMIAALALMHQLPAATSARNVLYTASGTFVTPQLSGADQLILRGEPFSMEISASEGLRPTRRTQNSALYTGLSIQGAVFTLLFDTSVSIPLEKAQLFLQMGTAGQPDLFKIDFTVKVINLDLMVSATGTLPPGTLTSTAIRPFTAPVALTPTDATVTYADSFASTTLAVALGSLDASVGPPLSRVNSLYQFTGPSGVSPVGTLAAGPNRALYGTTIYGGATYSPFPLGWGNVFQLTPGANGVWSETVLYSFTGGSDGGNPSSGVIVDSSGMLYGVTSVGGSSGEGTVFALDPATGMETVLHSFAGPDGRNPVGLVQGSNGILYGTTEYGGTYNFGTVFQLVPPQSPGAPWIETVLYSFSGQKGDGSTPVAGVVINPASGALYGTTSNGGASGTGTVFELAPLLGGGWSETILHSFGGPQDGGFPWGSLVMAADRTLYGTTGGGGNRTSCYGCGTVFSLTPPSGGGSWTESILYSFQGPAAGDGEGSAANLVLTRSGALYGTTTFGGNLGWGVIFKLTPASGGGWTETIPASFDFIDGANPAVLSQVEPGVLYGVATNGGLPACMAGISCGAVFQVEP